MLTDWLNANATRVTAYAGAALACVYAGVRERSTSALPTGRRWPVFWFGAATVLVAMLVGRAAGLERFLVDFGRDRARSGGWYSGRRLVQAAVVAAVAIAGLAAAYVAFDHAAARWRRYLPVGLGIVALVLFAALRAVSLHHVDAVLYGRSLGGVRVAAVAELALVALVVFAASTTSRGRPAESARRLVGEGPGVAGRDC